MSKAKTGEIGTSVGKYSKRQAAREAIEKCEGLGGGACELSLAYKNQCVVVAWGSENGVEVGGAVSIQGGPGVETATRLAIDSCSKMRRGGECKIVYSACSEPVLMD